MQKHTGVAGMLCIWCKIILIFPDQNGYTTKENNPGFNVDPCLSGCLGTLRGSRGNSSLMTVRPSDQGVNPHGTVDILGAKPRTRANQRRRRGFCT